MTKSEMLQRTRAALDEFRRLPPEKQFRQLVAWGVLDANGEVQFHRDGTDMLLAPEDKPFEAADPTETRPGGTAEGRGR